MDYKSGHRSVSMGLGKEKVTEGREIRKVLRSHNYGNESDGVSLREV